VESGDGKWGRGIKEVSAVGNVRREVLLLGSIKNKKMKKLWSLRLPKVSP
jgi:hypothetical protein